MTILCVAIIAGTIGYILCAVLSASKFDDTGEINEH